MKKTIAITLAFAASLVMAAPVAATPEARIIGPAGDPYMRYVCDNRPSSGTVTCAISWVSDSGRRLKLVTLAPGCVYRSGWFFNVGGTKTWVQAWVTSDGRSTQERLATRRVPLPDWYGPLWRGFERGLDCPVRIA